MMMVRDEEAFEVYAPTVEEGTRRGAEHFHVPAERLDVRVIEDRKRSLFGRGHTLRLRIAVREPDVDGTFDVRLVGAECRVVVTGPQGNGRRVAAADVQAALEDWPLARLDGGAVREAVESASGQPVTVGRLQLPRDLPAGLPCFVVVTRDRMRAYVFPVPHDEKGEAKGAEGRPPVTAEAVAAALRERGVQFGVNETAVRRFVAGRQRLRPVLVAQGVPCEDGADAKLEYLFRGRDGALPEEEVGRGRRVDYHEMFGVASVDAGDLLVRKQPATQGRPGTNVLGQTVAQKPGRDVDVARAVGAGTAVGPDGGTIVATTSGRPAVVGGRVTVTAVHRVEGDVNFGSGNIDFAGSVVVTGNVLAGFRVRARGDVLVKGFVEAAEIEAGGDVTIQAGVNGRGVGHVTAGGDVHARFFDWANVRAGGSVTAARELLRSHVVAGEGVVVEGAGILSGGEVRAGRLVQARVLGSEVGVTTKIAVGGGALPPGFGLRAEGPEDGADAVVVVRGTAYPGTVIHVHGAGYEVSRKIVFARFYYDEEARAVSVGPLH